MTVGFTCGAFDLLHAGHIAMLAECKNHCDTLIVGLQTDPTIDRPQKNKPIQSTFERFVQLNGLKYVDQIVPYDTEQDLRNIFATLTIHRRFVGEEYKGTVLTAQDLCRLYNIDIVYTTRQHNYSSSELRNRILENGRLRNGIF